MVAYDLDGAGAALDRNGIGMPTGAALAFKNRDYAVD
jgi:hypothetical protein